MGAHHQPGFRVLSDEVGEGWSRDARGSDILGLTLAIVVSCALGGVLAWLLL